MTPLDAYHAFLSGYGLYVEVGSEGILEFKYEGDHYTLVTCEKDPQYLGIRAIYTLPTGVKRAAALAKANDATRKAKVTKVYLLQNRGVAITTELFVADPEQMDVITLRMIRCVQQISAELFYSFTEGN